MSILLCESPLPVTAPLAADITARIQTVLASQPQDLRRQLRFEAAEGKITLQGRVKSYFHKQLAQEALRPLRDMVIDNQLEVEWRD
ncbi:MAG: BON domain-containing protein [Pirellulales bacterium]|nr:BON domain-containing protein [Pirellulales bacterium]